MDFSKISLFNAMNTKLKYHSARQAELAQNIANVDTPGYKATDVETPDFKKLVAGSGNPSARNLRLSATQAGHISGNTKNVSFRVVKRHDTYDLNPDGNNVSVEEEMMKASENQAEYTKVLNLYRKTTDLFKTALGRPNAG